MVVGAEDMIPREFGQHSKPGTWWLPSDGGRTIWKAFVTCPKCGADCALRLGHPIDETGNTDVVCPGKGCDWHETVTLKEWKA